MAISGAVLPRAGANCSRNQPLRETTVSALPSRASTRSRRLARTESPTTSAPPRTPAAVATPSSTATFVRQYQARLRASRLEIRMTQFVSHGEAAGQLRAVRDYQQNGLLLAMEFQQQRRHHGGGILIQVAG